MKLSNLVFAFASLSLASSAFAGILTLEDSASKVGNVTISKGGKLEVDGRSSSLITVAAGVRSKLGGLVKVYVGELLVGDKNKFACKADALASLANQKAVAVKMTMLYSISADDLEKAFNDGFENNEISETPAIKAFVAAVKAGGRPASGTKIAFSGEKLEDGSEVVTYENPAGKATSIKGGAGFVKSVFSLWLGNTGSDNGLKNVRDNFVNCEVK
jgi:hypothetical protein